MILFMYFLINGIYKNVIVSISTIGMSQMMKNIAMTNLVLPTGKRNMYILMIAL